MGPTVFVNRIEAGRLLAQRLAARRHSDRLDHNEVIVVGLPRGGVPVALEVALELHAPLDVILVRKLGVPFQPEVAMGAIGEGDVRVINQDVVRLAKVSPEEFDAVETRERDELRRLGDAYRAGRRRHSLKGQTVVIVDDGIATGSTAKAACQVARAEGAAQVVLAVPVAPPDWVERLMPYADELVALQVPADFHSVGQFYRDFAQTNDEDVVASLDRVARSRQHSGAGDQDVTMRVGHVQLGGHITVPDQPIGFVVFAHGSGSSRHSPRNRFVASVFNEAGLATLLFDLLTPREETQQSNVFDCGLLSQRLIAVTHEIRKRPELANLPFGFFGSSTGAAAALLAAAEPDADVSAIVSRGGRSDLAGTAVTSVKAPTLFIAGGHDAAILATNQHTKAQMNSDSQLRVVPGAGHLFEEPGTLRTAADVAASWFVDHFSCRISS